MFFVCTLYSTQVFFVFGCFAPLLGNARVRGPPSLISNHNHYHPALFTSYYCHYYYLPRPPLQLQSHRQMIIYYGRTSASSFGKSGEPGHVRCACHAMTGGRRPFSFHARGAGTRTAAARLRTSSSWLSPVERPGSVLRVRAACCVCVLHVCRDAAYGMELCVGQLWVCKRYDTGYGGKLLRAM